MRLHVTVLLDAVADHVTIDGVIDGLPYRPITQHTLACIEPEEDSR
jgi:hypothetical protein